MHSVAKNDLLILLSAGVTGVWHCAKSDTGYRTQGFMHAKHAFYQVSYILSSVTTLLAYVEQSVSVVPPMTLTAQVTMTKNGVEWKWLLRQKVGNCDTGT